MWDAFFVKKINGNVKCALLVYPDNIPLKDKQEAQKLRSKTENNEFYSSLDGFVSQSELISIIEKKSLINASVGQSKDILGRNFEQRVSAMLSSSDNLEKWKNPNKPIVGIHFDMYKSILGSVISPTQEVLKVEAFSDRETIGQLPSGGSPKTDVLVKIYLANNKDEIITISCKRSVAKAVSVHQYKASTFIDVLNDTDISLKNLLTSFQENPSLSAFGEEKTIQLTQALEPYLKKLTLWVLAGIGGSGEPEKQWATHLLTYNDESDDFSFYTIDEYYQKLLEQDVKGHFGTFFSWTYASKQRGKSIQLKCKII
jgi:hypothetical protein